MSSEADRAMPQDVAAIVVAAGASARMGGVDKLWADLDGAPVVAHAIRACLALPEVTHVVVVAPAERHDAIRALAGETPVVVRCVEGGVRRQDSVARGIAAAPDVAWYLVHDGARPLATPDLARRVLDAARANGDDGAAVPGVPVVDTLKRVDDAGRVVDSPDRTPLRAVQTPQAFAGPLLRAAYAAASGDVTDDAALVETLGRPVRVVEGDPANIKITTAQDLALAGAWLAVRRGTGA